VRGVDYRDHRIEFAGVEGVLVHVKGLDDRGRIGQPGGLDQDAVESPPALGQVAEYPHEIAAHRATDAAVVHLEDFLVRAHHQVVVHADFAELVDHHGEPAAVVLGQDAVEQGGLARPQIAGQNSHWNAHNVLAKVSLNRPGD